MVELKELGERLRVIRNQLMLTQKKVAAEAGLSQTVVSRLENGEEVYASALLTVLAYYEDYVSYDDILSSRFKADRISEKQLQSDVRQLLLRHLDIIKDAIIASNDTSLEQLDFLKRKLSE